MRHSATLGRAGPFGFWRPRDWSPDPEAGDDETSTTLQSAGASFAIVAAFPADADPERVVVEAIETLREEHPGLELDEIDDDFENSLASDSEPYAQEAVFFTLDTLAYCWLRSWRMPAGTVFVMLQTTEMERPTAESVFDGICRSLAPTEPA